jgi:hypothetical protein
VVQIQLTDREDTAPGLWTTLNPDVNPYYATVANNHFRCTFDPTDDGNNEDDFWWPEYPSRKFGPSSTCVGLERWSYQGDTSTEPFDVANVGNATTPPAPSDAPELGTGTWVRAGFDLSQYRGRRARFRFLVSSVKWGWEVYEDYGSLVDGWWIDDVVVNETLAEPAVISNDAFLLGSCAGTGDVCIGQCRNSLASCSDSEPCSEGEGDCVIPCPPGDACTGPPPDCGANCTQAEANAFVLPEGPLNPEFLTLTSPEESVWLHLAAGYDDTTDAEPSWVDACVDGYMEFRTCHSRDPDGDGPATADADCDDAWDVIGGYYEWSSFHSRRGIGTDYDRTYAFEVRCSSAPECKAGRKIEVIVQCPSRNPNTLGLRKTLAMSKEILAWQGRLDVDWLRGSFVSSDEIGNYVADFTDSYASATSIPMDGEPPAGTGYYYLVKREGPPLPFQVYHCDTVTWRSGGHAETSEPARNTAFGDP